MEPSEGPLISHRETSVAVGGDPRNSYPSALAGILTKFSLVILQDATWDAEGTVCSSCSCKIMVQFGRPLTRPHEA